MTLMRTILAAGLAIAMGAAIEATLAPASAQALDKVSFGTNWVAEAEHGGFYQALADGTYRKYGLDVTIVPGGPNSNNRILLIAGNLALLRSPYATLFGHRILLFDLGGTIAALVMFAMAIMTTIRHTAQLYRQEPLP